MLMNKRNMEKKRKSLTTGTHAEAKVGGMSKVLMSIKDLSNDTSLDQIRKAAQDLRPEGTKAFHDHVSQLTDVECLKAYRSLTTWQEFNNNFPGLLQEKLARGALKANGGTLPCFKCHKNMVTPQGVVSHTKKCRRRPATTLSDLSKLDLFSPPAKRKPPPRKTTSSSSLPSLEQLKEEPSIWLNFDEDDKLSILEKIYPTKPIRCFAIRTGSKNCSVFSDYRKAILHLDTCIQPMYLTYVGERANQFRSLDRKVRARYVREAMAIYHQLPCIECGRLFTHQYGLLYHIERCNVSEEEMPWKCYRCGYQTTRAMSHEHLKECWETFGKSKENPELPCNVMGTLGDVNLRSGKSIIKDTTKTIEIDGVTKYVTDLSAEEAVKSIIGSSKSVVPKKKKRRSTGNRPSVSAGVIPTSHTRVTISGDGKMRFRFRKIDTKGGVAGMAGYPRYLEQVRASHKKWCEEVSVLSYCERLSQLKAEVWKSTFSSSQLPWSSKESVGIRINEAKDMEHDEVPGSCHRVKAFTTLELTNDKSESVTIAYCGGPINAIRIAPNTMPSGEEVVAVVTYPCEATLIGKDMKSADGIVQFWLHSSSGENSMFVPWFILKCDCGLVFDLCWLDRPRNSPNDSIIGYFALGTAQGKVPIYRLDTTTVPSRFTRSQGLSVYSPNPGVILQQLKDKSSKNVEGETAEPSFAPPVHTLTWSAKGDGEFIVGVNAAGAAIIWDLHDDVDAPRILFDSNWSSPLSSCAFIGAYDVALAFRERLIRVIDVRTHECSLEENAVRTAGARVGGQPRLFNGFFTYQSEYLSSGDQPANGVSFICNESKADGYFVVPLSNRHYLMTWDVSVCPSNAVVASCGVDGKLLLSANGRLVTAASKIDFGFCMAKAALSLTRRRVAEPDTVNIATLFSKQEISESNESNEQQTAQRDGPVRRACPSYATHEETLEHLWLDVSLNSDPQAYQRRLEYSSLDLRVESLNSVATSFVSKPFVFTGGQAGLLFIRPCVIDSEISVMADLFQSTPMSSSPEKQPDLESKPSVN